MRRLLFAAIIGLLTTPAFAQDKNALATKYVNLPQVQNMFSEMFSPTEMGNRFAAGLPASFTLSEDKKQQIGVVMSDALNELRPRMDELMISGLADTYSEGELQALIDFVSSEHGISVMSKMSPFMTRVMGQLEPDMRALRNKIKRELTRIIQE